MADGWTVLNVVLWLDFGVRGLWYEFGGGFGPKFRAIDFLVASYRQTRSGCEDATFLFGVMVFDVVLVD